MSNKDIIKYFYEVIVSENLLDELHKYISEDCVQRVGEKAYFIGTEGMKQHPRHHCSFCLDCPVSQI